MRTFSQKRTILQVGISILLFLLAGCGGGGTPTPTPTPSFLEVYGPVTAAGEVVPGQVGMVAFSTSGHIEAILVAAGDQVTAGQELGRLDATGLGLEKVEAEAILRRAEAALEDLQAPPAPEAVAAAEAELAAAEAELSRLERAFARDFEINAAQARIDSAQAALTALQADPADTQVQAARAEVEAAKAKIDQIALLMGRTNLQAPFAGEIVEVYAAKGGFTEADSPVLMLADLENLQVVTVDLSEFEVTRLQVGDPAEITFDALPDQTFEGTIVDIADQAVPGDFVTYPVTLSLTEVPEGLRWGMTAFVTIEK